MADFNIKGNVGDAFIRITKDKDVHLIFGEDNESLYREVSWEGHEVYKCAVQFSLMIDSYLRNAKALDDLIGKDLLPILLAGAGLEEFEEVEDEFEISTEPKETYKDNIIQFKPKDKNNEDK